jgi:hypothetical protein
MLILGLILLVALMIPIVGILVDSPIGRAIGRRLEGPEHTTPQLADLIRKVEVLESEVEDLTQPVEGLKEENQFFQRLLEEGGSRPLPPPPSP